MTGLVPLFYDSAAIVHEGEHVTEAPTTYMTTLHLKVRAEAWPWLDQASREVNVVWNWGNATSAKAARPFAGKAKWLSGFDLDKLSAGATKCFDQIGADTIQRVNGEIATKRRQAQCAKLRWRISTGSKRSLGWVPFKAASIKRTGRGVTFCKKSFRVFEAERLEGVTFADGSFAQNALGEWFLNIPVKRPIVRDVAPREAVGIDLGLKRVATTSDGALLDAGAFYRDIEDKIAQAQRRGHKRQAKRYHAKAANRRLDALHVFTSSIVKDYQHIVVGDREQPEAGQDTDGEVRAGRRLGDAQDAAAVQGPSGRSQRRDRQRKKHHASMFQLWPAHRPQRSKAARCKGMDL
ncbi:transposase [Metallibacterium scheffleri]|uniref:Probable transposase IS891/IS1136/IS1341 domain-containing protein n=1 Tax=Metallibacterium scheffleri TaxID=993689 RepID=A0A4V3UTN5_9GAMM|nr:transposase [Metallibacterium scheffleri]THD11281.1 hypothetical protein B1806_03955 [Metallibacterium scheffleri]